MSNSIRLITGTTANCNCHRLPPTVLNVGTPIVPPVGFKLVSTFIRTENSMVMINSYYGTMETWSMLLLFTTVPFMPLTSNLLNDSRPTSSDFKVETR